jgi:hypothetical protein
MRPLVVIWAYWESVLAIEETADRLPVERIEQ